jgi:CelD/BcsL family acetyltransferase involved in cellulose biosynthesis
MRKVLALLVLLFFPVLGAAQTLALVNGEAITDAMVLAANPAAQNDPQARKQTLDVLVSRALLAQEAEKSSWLDHERLAATLATQRLDLLANAEAQHWWATHPPSEKQI